VNPLERILIASWAEFAAAAPDLADRGAKRLGVGVAYVATTARDGAPRISPFTPLIGGGRLLALIGKHTAKYSALTRDPRCAIHAWLGDSDEEFMIIARATPSDDWATRMQAAVEAKKINMTSQNDVAFEFSIERVHWALWEGLGTPGIRRVAESWRAGASP